MSKLYVFIPIFSFMFSFSACSKNVKKDTNTNAEQATDVPTADADAPKTQEAPSLQYEITYPPGWTTSTTQPGLLSSAKSPTKLDNPHRAAISITVSNNEYTTLNAMKKGIHQVLAKKNTILEEEIVSVNTKTAVRFSLLRNEKSNTLKQEFYAIPVHENLFFITTVAFKDDFESYRTEFERTLQSFQTWFKIGPNIDRELYSIVIAPVFSDIRSAFGESDVTAFSSKQPPRIALDFRIANANTSVSLEEQSQEFMKGLHQAAPGAKVNSSTFRTLPSGVRIFDVHIDTNARIRMRVVLASTQNRAIILSIAGPTQQMESVKEELEQMIKTLETK